jgi:hypothetical protein
MVSDHTVISSDYTVISSDYTVISSDYTVISSDYIVIFSDHTVISSDYTVISSAVLMKTVIPVKYTIGHQRQTVITGTGYPSRAPECTPAS